MPVVGGKKYNDVLWKTAQAITRQNLLGRCESKDVRVWMRCDQWDRLYVDAYERLTASFDRQLRSHGSSLNKVTISKRPKKGGGFTIVFRERFRGRILKKPK